MFLYTSQKEETGTLRHRSKIVVGGIWWFDVKYCKRNNALRLFSLKLELSLQLKQIPASASFVNHHHALSFDPLLNSDQLLLDWLLLNSVDSLTFDPLPLDPLSL